ncbi:PA26 p53-induced protein (sestrin) family protein [Leishmania donovani]|uniref:PA26 p53-induced protein (Sestrin) family protein n=1 Tax=Leishmania donovani TaxID=5661 RepID=A0A504Y718_LEIDO|nr:PA26 p53-induced protein (sestrin) family protein [Leishmania donovani]
MQNITASSPSPYAGGGHCGDHSNRVGDAATAASVFRDFTWYSATLLSHLFVLEHAQLERTAAAEENRRRAAAAHSPQLLMSAAFESLNASVVVASASAAAGSAGATSREMGDGGSIGRQLDLESNKAGADAATRWVPPQATRVAGSSAASPAAAAAAATATTTTAKTSAPDSAVTSLLAVFDAYYFPSELFDAAGPAASAMAGQQGEKADNLLLPDAGASAMHVATDGAEQVHGTGTSSAGAADSGAGSGTAAPRVAAEALREAFHDLLVLGQRCAVFALTYRGIVGCGNDAAASRAWLGSADVEGEDDAGHHYSPNTDGEHLSTTASTAKMHDAAGAGFSSEDDAKADEAVQQAASASLQFLLQLACSCPCAPLAYAAQLCIAYALAARPPPCCATGWIARQQLMRYLPTLQPQSRAVPATDASASSTAVGGPPPHCGVGGGGGSIATTSSRSGTKSKHIPTTQHVRPEDAMLWFDSTGAVHLMTAERWWDAQQQHAATCLAYCGPLPATTALPTVQRLLMEEEAYMGPNGSAAAVLKSVLEAVSAEVCLNARAISGSPSSTVHTSLRRRRGVHRGGGASAGGRRSLTGDGEEDAADGRVQSGSSTLSGACRVVGAASGSVASMGRAQGAAAVGAPTRLSKAAKRRRALLFALAQSHLLPPVQQLATSKTLLYGVFTDGGECPSYYKLLSLYPDVLRAHHAALHYVLYGDGPLLVDMRLMIAVMAASRHRCEYLVSRFSALLLRYAEEAMLEEYVEEDDCGAGNGSSALRGGHQDAADAYDYDSPHFAGPSAYPRQQKHRHSDESVAGCFRGQSRQRWITHGPPARLRAVQRFIALAAHTPWTLSEVEIRNVLACGWTVPEVFQLVAIVAQVVPLCGFVMGLFVPAEPWAMTLLPLEVVERLGHRAVTEDALAGPLGGSGVSSGGMAGCCPDPAISHCNSGGRGGGDERGSPTGGAARPPHADVYRRFAGDDNVVSEQRIKGGTTAANPPTLWRSRFTWNEMGATSMEQYYPGAATLLNEEIECYLDVVRQLTKADCVGLMSPDYDPSYAFRSLQLYVQNLVGFMVEDYSYNDINKVLRRPAKWFAQVLTMRPETLSRSEVVRWYVPTTPPTGKTSDMSAESSLVTHQLKREIELLSVVDSAQGGHRGGIESASAHQDNGDRPPPTPTEAARDAAEAEALQTALTLQDERVLLLIALATMEARKEGLLHILLRPLCAVLNNM